MIESLKQAKNYSGTLFKEIRGPEAVTRIKSEPTYGSTLQEIRKAVDEFLQSPILELTYSLYKQFETTGERAGYEKIYFERRARLNSLAFMVLLDEDEQGQYFMELQDILWSICGEYTWALPAHLGGKSLKNIEKKCAFNGIAYDRLPCEVVDLFAAETAFAVSEIVSLLSEKLESPVVQRVKSEVIRRVIQPYYNLNSSFNWETTDSNWAAVCAGSVGAAAMYIIEQEDMLAKILIRILDTLCYYIEGFGSDGACREGMAYWSYGTTFYISFAELLKQRTAGAIDLLNQEKFENIAKFMQRCKLHQNSVVNFSDSGPTFRFREGFLHKLKDKFSDLCVPPMEYRMNFGDDKCYRWAGFIRDIVWRKQEHRECRENNEAFHSFEDAEWCISRKQNADHYFYFAVKGGNNGESHNHNDIGHFIYQINDRALFIDLGAGKYTKEYFGPQRYTFFNTGSQGHSVPIINGEYQNAGSEYHAVCFKAIHGELDEVSMEIHKAYAMDGINSIIRRFQFYDDGRLLLTDGFKMDDAINVTERFIIACTSMPRLQEDGCVFIQNGNATALLKVDMHWIEKISIHETKEYYLAENQRVFVIDFDLVKREKEMKVSFEIQPINNEG